MRSVAAMPNHAQDTQNTRQIRTAIYKGMASLIWSQYCLENNVVRTPFEQAPGNVRQELLDICEATANAALNPDLKDTALLCMADAITRSASGGSLTISEVARAAQYSYLATAESALQAFLLNLRTVAPDQHYRESMGRLIDVIAPKKGAH
jgi:hypothetical protein